MIRKWFSIWVLMIVLLSAGLGPIAFAQEEEAEEEDSSAFVEAAQDAGEDIAEDFEEIGENVTKSLSCLKGFGTFLTQMIDMDNFAPYWVDIFTKNMCYLEDIFALEDEMDAIQENLRESYYSCDTENVEILEKEYKIKKTEFYFVRHCIAVDDGALNSEEIEEVEDNWAFYLYDELYEEMVDKFVENKGWFDDDTFKAYFDSWAEEYTDNMLTYVDCNYGDWQEVAEKIKGIVADIKALAGEIEKKKDPEEEEDEEGLGAKDTPGNKVKEYFKKHLGFNFSFVEDVSDDLAKQWDKVQEGVEEASGTSGGDTETPSIAEFFDTYVEAVDTYESDATEATLMAEYQTAYGEIGSAIGNAFTDLLSDLGDTLNETSDTYLSEIKKSTKKISNKQCK